MSIFTTRMPFNFVQLIIGKSFLNIADSFYAVAVTIGLVQVYDIEAGSLSVFTLVSMLPALLAVFLVPMLWLKLALMVVGFIVIGISGNYFSKMLFASYQHDMLGSVQAIIQTLYAVFGVLFLLVPLVYSNITVLGVIFNGMTLVCGALIGARYVIADRHHDKEAQHNAN